MRDRLIELLTQKQVYGIDQDQPCHDLRLIDNEELADHLLANGVIVPFCGGLDGKTIGSAMLKQLWGAVYALADMVFQFGYSTTFRKKDALCDGGLSALENAFEALLEVGCKLNSNGTISTKNLLDFMVEADRKRGNE